MTRVLTLDIMGNQSGGKGSCLKQSSVLGSTVEQARRKYIMTMSMREIFNKVEKHLLKQNTRSIRVGSCKYRTDSGLSCAVGCLMTDNMYSHTLEGESVRATEVVEALAPIIGVSPRHRAKKLDLLHRLQGIHDGDSITEWDVKLSEAKLDFNIS